MMRRIFNVSTRITLAMTTLLCPTLVSAADLVADGELRATIVLPEATQWDRYVNATPEEVRQIVGKRFPNATDKQLDAAANKLSKLRARNAKQVGDDEQLAADELAAFVKKITGAEPPIQRVTPGDDLPEGTCILLGSAWAKHTGHGDKLDQLGPHGFLISTDGDRVVIAGRRARGTLYGAYELLESFGCRWIMPGDFGEIIPTAKSLSTDLNDTQNPSHPQQRYWWCTSGQGEEFARWTLRNKGSFLRGLEQPRIMQGHHSDRPLAWGAKGDRGEVVTKTVKEYGRDENKQIIRDRAGKPAIVNMVEKEVRRLPEEYHAMVAGEANLHFANMVNPKAWKLYADYYEDWFYKNPESEYASISAADGLIVDDRDLVRDLDSGEWDWTQGARTATDRLWFFHNRYLDEVREDVPDAKFGVLVYSNNMSPPRIERVHPSMALVYAPLSICPLHHVRDEKCKTNRIYAEWLPAWLKQQEAAGAEGYYYDYFPIGFSWSNFIIAPQWRIIGRNYPWFHEMGLDGHTTQGFDDFGALGLTAWVAIRLYWDVTQDYEDLVREYCKFRFGEQAADAMHDYYRVYADRMDEIPDICSNEIWGSHIAINAQTREAARKVLAKAKPLVKGEREQRHYQTAVDFQRAMDAWCDGIDHARETADFAAASEQMAEAFEIKDQLNKLYSHFINPTQTATDPDKVHNLRRYRASGYYNKYRLWADVIANSGASVALPRDMAVKLDTDNIAWAEGLQNPDISVDSLDMWDSTIVPDVKYQTQREPAAFFYRTEVNVPQTFAKNQTISIFFPSMIAKGLQLWINGEQVMFDHDGFTDITWRGPPTFWYDYNHSQIFDVTGHIKPGQTNTIAFRIFKSYDHGGTYDRVFLLGDAPPIR